MNRLSLLGRFLLLTPFALVACSASNVVVGNHSLSDAGDSGTAISESGADAGSTALTSCPSDRGIASGERCDQAGLTCPVVPECLCHAGKFDCAWLESPSACIPAVIDRVACPDDRPVVHGEACSKSGTLCTGTLMQGTRFTATCAEGSFRRDVALPSCLTRDAGTNPADAEACPSDFAKAEGTACVADGQVCGTCADKCQFCNQLVCSGGVWTHRELFPAPCLDGGPSDGSTGPALARTCAEAACKEGSVCIGERVTLDVIILPNDAGACPPELQLENGVCQSMYQFVCKPRPSTCARDIDCGCGGGLCTPGYACSPGPVGSGAALACQTGGA